MLPLSSPSKCLFHRYQDKLPELVVLTAASAKLVAKVFIRAGQSTQEAGGALLYSFAGPAVKVKVITALDRQTILLLLFVTALSESRMR